MGLTAWMPLIVGLHDRAVMTAIAYLLFVVLR